MRSRKAVAICGYRFEIGGKTGELDDLRNEIGAENFWILSLPRPNAKPCHRDWSPFGNEKERLLGTLRSFDPSLPRLGAGKLRTGLEAQSSIASLMDAVRLPREN